MSTAVAPLVDISVTPLSLSSSWHGVGLLCVSLGAWVREAGQDRGEAPSLP